MPTEELADQSFESILPQEEPAKEKKFLTLGKLKIKAKTAFLLGGGLFIALILLVILANFLSKTSKPSPPPAPTPTPTPFEEKIASPSAYATDSAILRIEGELEILEEKLLSTDLRETALNPPVLDMDVNFKE